MQILNLLLYKEDFCEKKFSSIGWFKEDFNAEIWKIFRYVKRDGKAKISNERIELIQFLFLFTLRV